MNSVFCRNCAQCRMDYQQGARNDANMDDFNECTHAYYGK